MRKRNDDGEHPAILPIEIGILFQEFKNIIKILKCNLIIIMDINVLVLLVILISILLVVLDSELLLGRFLVSIETSIVSLYLS